MSDSVVDDIRKPHEPSSSSSSSERTNQTSSMSTLMSDPQDLFNHSITDLDSFSTSLDFDRHLPSAEAREAYLSQLMGEEEIPGDFDDDDLGTSFACDLDRSIPTRLGTTIEDDEEEEEEDDDNHGDNGGSPSNGESLSKSNHRVAEGTTA